jgi:transposase
VGVDRGEAEAVYDAGREACVEVLLALAARIEQLERRVERLEEESRRNSDNSSLPPSQDPRPAKQRHKPAGGGGSGRAAGGQPGHPGSGRGLLPSERVDEVVEYLPARCAGCGHSLEGAPAVGGPHRHQVAELPEVSVSVAEHRLLRRRCPACGEQTKAALPEGVPAGRFGPRLQAAIGTLAGRFRLSRRQIAELCEELFGCEIATGTIDSVCQRLGAALEDPQERLLEAVRRAPCLCVDETGWRERGERRALWGAFSDEHALLEIADSRHREVAEGLLEGAGGIVSSDRWWAYDYLAPERRQVCWSHLLRDFRFHAEGLTHQKEFGEACLRIAERLFQAWHDFQADGDRRRLRRRTKPLQRELRELLERAARKGAKTRHHRRFARNLLRLWPALWTFVERDGVEPTNNAAERGLRHAVIARKLSLGNQAEHGKRTTERLLSASITCRLQGRSLFTYLATAIEASIRGQPTPSLA